MIFGLKVEKKIVQSLFDLILKEKKSNRTKPSQHVCINFTLFIAKNIICNLLC